MTTGQKIVGRTIRFIPFIIGTLVWAVVFPFAWVSDYSKWKGDGSYEGTCKSPSEFANTNSQGFKDLYKWWKG